MTILGIITIITGITFLLNAYVFYKSLVEYHAHRTLRMSVDEYG